MKTKNRRFAIGIDFGDNPPWTVKARGLLDAIEKFGIGKGDTVYMMRDGKVKFTVGHETYYIWEWEAKK